MSVKPRSEPAPAATGAETAEHPVEERRHHDSPAVFRLMMLTVSVVCGPVPETGFETLKVSCSSPWSPPGGQPWLWGRQTGLVPLYPLRYWMLVIVAG